ncbi:MAG TPA: hypothetical protein VES40_03815, partial [Ilumatobacteraceae bacterium]|nr:hypothetical protein [Ilumatobacteraceae bacterium]
MSQNSENSQNSQNSRNSHDSDHYVLDVNGAPREVTDSWLGESLLDVLRDRLGLMGTKGAC